jgi:hypothetical protein
VTGAGSGNGISSVVSSGGLRLEPYAADVSDKLVAVLQQIYLNFLLVFAVDIVLPLTIRLIILESVFMVRWLCRSRLNRTARELPKRRRCLREWERGRTRARSCRLDPLSGGRSRAEPASPG